MPRYYFDTFNGVEHIRDETGLEFPNRNAASFAAQDALPDIARAQLPDGNRRDFIVDVRDSVGLVIYTCTLSLTGRRLDHSLSPMANRSAD